jgi:signal transduction histidine kinase
MEALGPVRTPLHILLVEDAEHDGLLSEAMLHQIPGGSTNRVTRAAEAAAACQILDAGGIDVVLLDLTLPDSEGTDTVRRIARSGGEVPIVVLTGTDDEAQGLECIRCGAQDYVPKNDLRVPLLGRVIGYARARAREAVTRRMLEQEVLETSERERQRIAHDLHDDLGQQLTGIALLGRSLAAKLSERGIPEAAAATELTELVRKATGQSMALARGLDPLTEHGSDLPDALDGLARRGELMFSVRCRVEQTGTFPALPLSAGAHLYRIAQEALTNAVKHGKSSTVSIGLHSREGVVELVVSDDGSGIPEMGTFDRGQGMRIMEYRAGVIGGALDIGLNDGGHGTRVRCRVPVPISSGR